jgi:hypothetical protein
MFAKFEKTKQLTTGAEGLPLQIYRSICREIVRLEHEHADLVKTVENYSSLRDAKLLEMLKEHLGTEWIWASLHALRRYDLSAEQRDQKNLIVLVLDEAQETVLVSEDGISDYNVVDKIRGARATTINSTQSPTSYIPPMGSREKADVFLLNLGNKVYFTAADKLGSDMIADSIGKHTIKKRTYVCGAPTTWNSMSMKWPP